MGKQAFLFLTVVAAMLLVIDAKTVRHTFRISYITGSPDGVRVDHILAINGGFPGPTIVADAGDILEITVVNDIQDGQNVTIHWHGIIQRGTPFEDGPSEITQCGLKQGKSQLYRFPVPHSGTYWYHSHVNSQYTEGLWGLLIINAIPETYRQYYDDEIVITLNDWYHTSGHENEEFLLSRASGGAPPYPSSALMNGVGRYPCNYATRVSRNCIEALQRRPVFLVQPGKTYRLRLVNTAGWIAFNFTIDGHTLRTIEVDGVDTLLGDPVQAVYIAAGQRYSFLLTIPANGQYDTSSLIRASVRKEFLFTRPANINLHPESLLQEVTGRILYSRSSYESIEQFDHTTRYVIFDSESWGNLKFLNEMSIIPYDRMPVPRNYSRSLVLSIGFDEDSEGIRRGNFNHRPAIIPVGGIPQLVMMVRNHTIPESMFPVYIKYGEIVQVIINNPEEGPHPIHLHGHHFWVLGMGHEGDGNYNPEKHNLNYGGLRRDTVLVKERSWTVIRFKADNVGVWTLHCHLDWHMLTGMMMTFVEAPELAHKLQIPEEARRVCADHNVII